MCNGRNIKRYEGRGDRGSQILPVAELPVSIRPPVPEPSRSGGLLNYICVYINDALCFLSRLQLSFLSLATDCNLGISGRH